MIDDSPPSPHTSQKRKWASDEERQAGDHLRKNILTKKFEWMEPKDRPNFTNRNPYKPLDLDPTEHEQYPTQALHYYHDLGQASQEPPLAPSQAPAHLPALAKLPNPKISQPSGPRARRLNKDELGGNARAESMSEARERMKAKKKQIDPHGVMHLLAYSELRSSIREEAGSEGFNLLGTIVVGPYDVTSASSQTFPGHTGPQGDGLKT